MPGRSVVLLGMEPLIQGNLVAREAISDQDVRAALDLRDQTFIRPSGSRRSFVSDADSYDTTYSHMLIERQGRPVGCFRVKICHEPRTLLASYSGRHYDLQPLSELAGPFADIGRLTVDHSEGASDILRMVWGALARLVDVHQLRYLLGCTSFSGADPVRHASALSALCNGHLGPAALQPHRKAGAVVDLTQVSEAPDATRIPPLLRSYLALGAWVSDHAVIDRHLDTLHVFTLLEIAAIPPGRARLLRRIAAGSSG